jgi:hypothetical protein
MTQLDLFPPMVIYSTRSDMVVKSVMPTVEFRNDVPQRYIKTFLQMMSWGQIKVYDAFGNKLNVKVY